MGAYHVSVNGRSLSLDGVAAHTSVLSFLRAAGLTGVKEGCAEGECGACSVLLARPGVDATTEWTAINACLQPALALADAEVVTAEGLGSPDSLHPVQQALAEGAGSQCGFCTPGFVCSMAAEYYRPGRDEFDLHAIAGNLCRCTGYRPIRDAALALGSPESDDTMLGRGSVAPPVIEEVSLSDFARPTSLDEALTLLAAGGVAVAGATDLGVEVNLRGRRDDLLVSIAELPELRTFSFGPDVVEIGAALSLTTVERLLDGRIPLLDALLPQFASRLIRNAATLGGNLGTASPIGDSAPALLALDASLVIASAEGSREVPLATFFEGYRQTSLAPAELITAIRIPLPLLPTAGFHKIAKRKLDDISSVAIAYAFRIEDDVVAAAQIGLGGIAATPVRATATEAALVGRPWTFETAVAASEVLGSEGTPLDDHRASAAYRKAMLRNSLLKFFEESL